MAVEERDKAAPITNEVLISNPNKKYEIKVKKSVDNPT